MQADRFFLFRDHLLFLAEGEKTPQDWRLDITDLDSTLASLSQHLDGLGPGRGKACLVLSPDWVRFDRLVLPPLPPRRVGRLLEFELDNLLLRSRQESIYGFSSRTLPAQAATWVSLWSMDKELLDALLRPFTQAGWEMAQVTPLASLIDHLVRQEIPQPEGIVLLAQEEGGWVLSYQETCLLGVAYHPYRLPGQNQPLARQIWLQRVGQSLAAILLEAKQPLSLKLAGGAHQWLEVTEGKRLLPLPGCQPPLTDWAALAEFKGNKHLPLINLVSNKNRIWRDLALNKPALLRSALLLTACLLLYLGSSLVEIQRQKRHLASLQTQFSQAARSYRLPSNLPAAKLVGQLRQEVSQARKERQGQNAGLAGDYPLSRILAGLSKSKRESTDLVVQRMTYNAEALSLQGLAASREEVELFLKNLEELFPQKLYSHKSSQKSQGDGTRFSISIHLRKGKDGT